MSSDERSAGVRSGRMRFGLRTMLLVVAIVCLAIPLVIQSRRLRDAEAELMKLRDETGRITITDRSKVHVMAVDSAEPGTWRWRLFVPKGARYGWSLAQGDIPASGLPQPSTNAFSNAQGEDEDKEVLVTASLQKAERGDWYLSVSSRIGGSNVQMGSARISITNDFMKSAHNGCEVGSVTGSNETKLLDPGKPIVLLTHRACGTTPDGSKGPTDVPTPGYVIWMTPF